MTHSQSPERAFREAASTLVIDRGLASLTTAFDEVVGKVQAAAAELDREARGRMPAPVVAAPAAPPKPSPSAPAPEPRAPTPALARAQVFTSRKITDDFDWIYYVSHDADDGAWQFLPKAGLTSEDDAVAVELEEILRLDPSVAALADLPRGWCAWRDDADAVWQRSATG